MAELNIQDNGKKRSAKKPDMTPLVDLGFLLITFFIYTTTFSVPNVMDFASPSKEKGTSVVNHQNSLTLILDGKDKVYWYQRPLNELEATDIVETNYGSDGIRKLINDKKKLAKDPESWTVIIKPTAEATWKNAIDVLDETFITGSNRKAITELTDQEILVFSKLVDREVNSY